MWNKKCKTKVCCSDKTDCCASPAKWISWMLGIAVASCSIAYVLFSITSKRKNQKRAQKYEDCFETF